MAISTFSVFLDENIPSSMSSTTSSTTSSRKPRPHHNSHSTTKENINPLTGLPFDTQPPLKKRKPSPSSALKVKALSSSSKSGAKTKKLSSLREAKEKGKKRAVLGTSGNRNKGTAAGDNSSDTEQSLSSLGNRRAYEFSVMPLADVTQAYDEREALRSAVQTGLHAVEENPQSDALWGSGECDIEMHDTTSKEAIQSTAGDAIEA
ncbi:hypothetical protein BU17DRAFT_84947 [Hysterangium stoloniferum]|nr:hypothetical protein BU17DRAFT_84947 [Hysterangium stoloniferum]